MSYNVMKLSTEQFLNKLTQEVQFIENHLLNRLDSENKEKYNYYYNMYKKIQKEISEKIVENPVDIYGQFLKTVKKFKRQQDNIIKFNERDIDSFRKRYENTQKPLIPLIHDIKMNVLERMTKFDINQLKSHNFQMHLYTNKELCDITFKMMEYQGIYKDQSSYTAEQMKLLIKNLCLNYNVIPYHNWTHAFSVFQMLFCCYENSPSWRDYILPFEFFCAQIAALGHDLNHKGLGNLYKVKRNAQCSINYCELGVLENMHASKLFQILQNNNDLNYFTALKDQNKIQQFKRIIVSCITSTDMQKHSKLTAKLKRRIQASIKIRNFKQRSPISNHQDDNQQDSNTNSSENFQITSQDEEDNSQKITDLDKFSTINKDNFEDRRFLLNIILHACDIGNPCLEYNNYMNWSYLITQEFSDQTQKEEQYNLPVTGFLIYKDKLTFLNGQTFFCKAMVLPLWQEIGDFFPELKIYPQSIENNLKELENRKNKIKQQIQSA
ncbi:hypothetical protein ABPG73_000937 [Tetrahymena malaccensis]